MRGHWKLFMSRRPKLEPRPESSSSSFYPFTQPLAFNERQQIGVGKKRGGKKKSNLDREGEGELSLKSLSLSNTGSSSLPELANQKIEGNVYPSYFEILQKFDNVYPKQTNVFCWWCCHPFKTPPIGIPVVIEYAKDEDTSYKADFGKGKVGIYSKLVRDDVFKVKGCFCSFPCALAYMQENKSIQCNYSQFVYFYKKVTGDTESKLFIDRMKPAPPRCTLKIFGGVLTIDDYRKQAARDKHYHVIQAPLIPVRMFAEEGMMSRPEMKGLGIQMADPVDQKTPLFIGSPNPTIAPRRGMPTRLPLKRMVRPAPRPISQIPQTSQISQNEHREPLDEQSLEDSAEAP